MLKKIGTEARLDIEAFIEKKVFLEFLPGFLSLLPVFCSTNNSYINVLVNVLKLYGTLKLHAWRLCMYVQAPTSDRVRTRRLVALSQSYLSDSFASAYGTNTLLKL